MIALLTRSGVRPSVCPTSPVDQQQQRRAAGLLLSALRSPRTNCQSISPAANARSVMLRTERRGSTQVCILGRGHKQLAIFRMQRAVSYIFLHHGCGPLLRMSHVPWSVSVCWAYRWTLQKRLSRLRCHLGRRDSRGTKRNYNVLDKMLIGVTWQIRWIDLWGGVDAGCCYHCCSNLLLLTDSLWNCLILAICRLLRNTNRYSTSDCLLW